MGINCFSSIVSAFIFLLNAETECTYAGHTECAAMCNKRNFTELPLYKLLVVLMIFIENTARYKKKHF